MTAATAIPASRRLASANVLVGVDDTDSLESRGTGRLARALVQTLGERGLGRPLGVTRHQLLVDPRIPYTSHNSSACIALDAGGAPDLAAIASVTGALLEEMSAAGSDPGLAVTGALARAERGRLSGFGALAKRDVLDQATARALAHAVGVHLSAHGGDGGGIIGALAAVGLHGSGADGRFLWMPGLRELAGEVTYGDLLAAVPVDAALDPSGLEPASRDVIDLGDWVRPVWRDGRAVLLLEALEATRSGAGGPRRWTASRREAVKSH